MISLNRKTAAAAAHNQDAYPGSRAAIISALAPISALFVAAALVFVVTRLVLAIYTGFAQVPASLWPGVFLRGMLADLATLAFLAAPLLLYEALVPNRWRRSRWHRLARVAWISFALFALLFGAAAEFTFWVEFYNRFNFIAVDYLIYTHEVIRNIVESYPIVPILGALALCAALLAWPVVRFLKPHENVDRRWSGRLVLLTMGLLLPMLSANLFRVDANRGSGNEFADELAQNGLHTFARALRKNEIDYDRFYATITHDNATAILQALAVRRPPAADPGMPAIGPKGLVEASAGAASATSSGSSRVVLKRRPKHLVLVSVESLSAEFLGAYGSKLGLTPMMDQLMTQSVRFDAMFATGTRTVRGLEALSLGVPPVPGQSIVRRDGNDKLAMLGNLLDAQGFGSMFVYGGYGYFDNMSAYFGANNHQVVDRTDIPKERIVFENAWGVADEVIFDHTLSAMDKTIAGGKRAFAHVMTTSNHRPYTYPADRIDIPSPGGRRGAVKYTDWAIGKFIEDARKKPWFDDTLFVIIADHCSSVAGKVKLPVGDYHIAAMLYGPQIVAPARYTGLVSQIDLPPTLLEALGVAGADQFFGRSLLASPNNPGAPERAFISNYQHLGLLRDGVLTILSPKRAVEAYQVDMSNFASKPIEPKAAHVQEAIAYYQTASRAFQQGALKAKPVKQ